MAMRSTTECERVLGIRQDFDWLTKADISSCGDLLIYAQNGAEHALIGHRQGQGFRGYARGLMSTEIEIITFVFQGAEALSFRSACPPQ